MNVKESRERHIRIWRAEREGEMLLIKSPQTVKEKKWYFVYLIIWKLQILRNTYANIFLKELLMKHVTEE